jgi:diguanylate cyclase (GGDEF)-like protein
MAGTMPANEPIQVLHMSVPSPDWSTSAYGPFVVHPAATLDEVAEQIGRMACDAVVLRLDGVSELASLAAWAGMPRLLLDAAVLVVAPEPAVADALRLLRMGVQDVLPTRESGDEALARATRLAVERHRLDRAARKAYATDLGTGLPNRAQLMEHMTHLLALREREPAAMALLALRIEGVAAAEARLGTEAANVLRRKVAVRLRSGLRASDVVAAIGEDTFAVLLAWIDDPDDGERVARKLVQAIKRPFTVSGQDLALAVRVGVAQYPAHAKDAMGLIHRALVQAGEAVAVGRAAPPLPGGQAANDD